MVSIRLTRKGTKHKPHYRIVVIEKEKPRDSNYLDLIGYYKPMSDPVEIKIDQDKYDEWIKKGAKASQTVKSLIKKVNSDNKGG